MVRLSPQAEAWGYTDKACEGRLDLYSLTVHGEGYLNRMLTPHPDQPLPLVRSGETKRSFGGVGFKFCDLCKRSAVSAKASTLLIKHVSDNSNTREALYIKKREDRT